MKDELLTWHLHGTENVWVPDRNRTHDLPNTWGRKKGLTCGTVICYVRPLGKMNILSSSTQNTKKNFDDHQKSLYMTAFIYSARENVREEQGWLVYWVEWSADKVCFKYGKTGFSGRKGGGRSLFTGNCLKKWSTFRGNLFSWFYRNDLKISELFANFALFPCFLMKYAIVSKRKEI